MSKLNATEVFSQVSARSMRHAARRALYAGSAALLLSFAGIYAGCSSMPGSTAQVREPRARDPWFGASRSGPSSPESTFAVKLDAESTSPDAPGQKRFLHVAGTWTLTKASLDKSRQVLAQLKVSELALSDEHTAAVGKQKYNARIRAELERAVILDLNERGAIVGMRVPRDLVSTASGALKMLASSFQLSTAPADVKETWKAEEQDVAGTYLAEYRALGADATGASGAITRKKISYTKLPEPEADSAPLKYEITSSESKFELGSSGEIASCTGSEIVSLDGAGAVPRLETTTRFTITRKADTTRKTPLQDALLMAMPSQPLNAAPAPEALAYELDLAKAANGTQIDTILADMARTDPKQGSGDAHAFRRLGIALEAAVRIDEEAETQAFDRVDAGAPYAAEILGALARSNRPEALLKVAKRLEPAANLSAKLRARALMALCANANASPAVVQTLQALTPDPQIGDGVVLGLGALAYRLQRTNKKLSDEIYESLAARLDKAQTFAESELALRALGNAGNSASLPKLEPLLASFNPKVRALAVGALRRIEDPAVNTILASMEQNDPSEDVKDAIQNVRAARING